MGCGADFRLETRRLGVTDLQFRPEVSDGLFLRLAITSVDSLACAYAAVLAEAKRYQEAAELLDATDPRHPFDAELVSYVRGVLYFRTKRWPDVLAQFPEATQWRHPELKAAGAAMATTALASLGVFEEAFGALRKQSKVTGCRARLTSPCTPKACACGTSAVRRKLSNSCAACIRAMRSSPRPARRWITPTFG